MERIILSKMALLFPAGKTRDTLDITLINDTIDEPSQTLIPHY